MLQHQNFFCSPKLYSGLDPDPLSYRPQMLWSGRLIRRQTCWNGRAISTILPVARTITLDMVRTAQGLVLGDETWSESVEFILKDIYRWLWRRLKKTLWESTKQSQLRVLLSLLLLLSSSSSLLLLLLLLSLLLSLSLLLFTLHYISEKKTLHWLSLKEGTGEWTGTGNGGISRGMEEYPGEWGNISGNIRGISCSPF